MIRFSSWAALSALGVASFVGCASGDEPAAPAPAARIEQPILGGSLDTVTQSAVAVGLVQAGTSEVYGVCTGSLVKVDRANDVAYVLTAAHCASGEVEAVDVRIGNDWREPDVILAAAQVTVDENYALSGGESDDFAVIALRNLPATLPTPFNLPGATDGVSTGTSLFVAGYGNTVSYGDPSGTTRFRKSKTLTVADASDARILTLDQPQGGLCDGDSGGPALLGTTVVGVASYVGGSQGDNPCIGTAVSARVSSGLPFIQAVLNGQTPPPPNACLACRAQTATGGICKQKHDFCEANAACKALTACLQTIESAADQQACIEQNPGGVGPLTDALDCPCADACTTECSGNAACAEVEACGFQFQSGPYNTCMLGACCTEMDKAIADPLGYRCLAENPPPAGCDTNAATVALNACSDAACGTGSSSSGGSSSGRPSSSSGGGGEGDDDTGDDDSADDDTGRSRVKKDDDGGCQTGGSVPSSWLSVVGALGWVLRRRSVRRVA